MGKIKLILFLIVIIPLMYFIFQFLPTETEEFEKSSDKIISDGAKFTVEILAEPIENIETPFQFKVINGVEPPDPEICILNITVNDNLVLDEEECVGENETLKLVFDYESEEDETEWNILAFYSVNQTVKSVTMFLKKKPVEEGYDVSLIMNLPDVARRGEHIRGSATFTSDSSSWINVEKAVLILKKSNDYFKFEKVIDQVIPPKFRYTTDYGTTLPADIDAGSYIVQGILYYTENKVEKAVSYDEYIEIV